MLHPATEIEDDVTEELCLLLNICICARSVKEANVIVGHAIHQHEPAEEEDSLGPFSAWLGNEDMIDSGWDEDGTQVILLP